MIIFYKMINNMEVPFGQYKGFTIDKLIQTDICFSAGLK